MDETLEVRLGALLFERKLTVSTAESCTGGLVAHRLTNISGSSAYVMGGVVTYSNEAKEHLLHVKHETLLAHGAVSEETAIEMALGALTLFDTDFAVSITGIAGPGGGTEQKPVGLTYIGLGRKGQQEVRVTRHLWPGDRLAVKTASADAALKMILDALGT
jgi:PncC family amidohydrolase